MRILRQVNRSANSYLSGKDSDGGQDGRDNVNVVIRVRPFNSSEKNRGENFILQFPGNGQIWVDNPSGNKTKPFAFNVVFEPEATQQDVFEYSGVQRLIDMAIEGYACTIFAYGQTGSGKTHTITGPASMFENFGHLDDDLYGLIQRSFMYLFKKLENKPGVTYIINASYLEIYNEQVIDLLNVHKRKSLAVRWSKDKGFYVENLFIVECVTLDDVMAVLEEGLRNKQVGSHSLNEYSSRSHTILTLTIESEIQDDEDESIYITKHGKLCFVDLAGSEKVKESNTYGDALNEANNINKSLLVLGTCISSLGDSKKRQSHIPYRDSKLTKLLADCLGGNGVALMIACVSPSSNHTTETLNTLRYANRAKRIKNKPIVKMDPREAMIISFKKEIKRLKAENQYFRQQLEFPTKVVHHGSESATQQSKSGSKKEKSNTKKVESAPSDNNLYEMLQEYMVENEALKNENCEVRVNQEKLQREFELICRENERLYRKLEDVERVFLSSPIIDSRRSNLSLSSATSSQSFKSGYCSSCSQDMVLLSHHGTPQTTPPVRNRPYSLSQTGDSLSNDNSRLRWSSDDKGPTINTSLGPRKVSMGPRRPPHRLSEPITKDSWVNTERMSEDVPRQDLRYSSKDSSSESSRVDSGTQVGTPFPDSRRELEEGPDGSSDDKERLDILPDNDKSNSDDEDKVVNRDNINKEGIYNQTYKINDNPDISKGEGPPSRCACGNLIRSS